MNDSMKEKVLDYIKTHMNMEPQLHDRLCKQEAVSVNDTLIIRVLFISDDIMMLIIDKKGENPIVEHFSLRNNDSLTKVSQLLNHWIVLPCHSGSPLPSFQLLEAAHIQKIASYAGLTATCRLEQTSRKLRSQLKSESALPLWLEFYDTLPSQFAGSKTKTVITSSLSASKLQPQTVQKVKESCKGRVFDRAPPMQSQRVWPMQPPRYPPPDFPPNPFGSPNGFFTPMGGDDVCPFPRHYPGGGRLF
eukprot:GDKJ01055033.1.p1 GENE.GDKJ01055033.1~~GDKJ01055033.1.p1  ORF type:complete len:247 (-),score=32.09 GDKJ01055033.1:33-773(-)